MLIDIKILGGNGVSAIERVNQNKFIRKQDKFVSPKPHFTLTFVALFYSKTNAQ